MKKQQQHIIKGILFVIFLFTIQINYAQNINLEQLVTGKLFKVTGNVSANTVFYNANQTGGRAPFTYFIQGGLNVGVYQFSMPITYSYSNQGDNLNYQIPFKFNRLSLHPKYKWVQAHLGDANMTFSPYTLSAHQFTGGGIELTPKGGVKFSAMTGQLLKATEDDGDPRTQPAFKRMGYGAKASYEKKKYKIGVIGFYAKDDINSINAVPDEKGVTPKENLVVSFEGAYSILKDLELKAEYASSALTKDLRASDSDLIGSGLASRLFNNKTSTAFYGALKAGLDYRFDKSSVGLAYERIDPGYETLGAYYFNNDFENITVKATTSLFKDKVNLSFNIGYQRDDLSQQKESATSRTVGAVNATYAASKKLQITGSYSNFSTFTNLKTDQFEVINDDNLLDDEQDALDYKQLSQNANLNINYILAKSKSKQQQININYALADVSNEQGGVVRLGDASTFHNMNFSYSLGYPKVNLTIAPAVNATYNTIGREDAFTWGPTLAINKKFFDKKVSTSFATSYNTSKNQNSSTSILNFRVSANYSYKKKHNFNLRAIQLLKNNTNSNLQSLTITFGYNYAFDLTGFNINLPKKREKIKEPKKSKEKKVKKKKNKEEKVKVKKVKKKKKLKPFKFSYKTHLFEGVPHKITPNVTSIKQLKKFKNILEIKNIVTKLEDLEEEINKSEEDNKKYKKVVITYLQYLYDNKDFKEQYDNIVFKSLKKLYNESRRMNYIIEKSFIEIQGKVNSAIEKDPIDVENLKKKKNQFLAHTWMMDKLYEITFMDVKQDKGLLKIFRKEHLSKVFELLEQGNKEMEIKNYLELNLIKLYHSEALKQIE